MAAACSSWLQLVPSVVSSAGLRVIWLVLSLSLALVFAKQVSEFGKITWVDRDLRNLGGAEVFWRYTD
jgi:hypothetical protein